MSVFRKAIAACVLGLSGLAPLATAQTIELKLDRIARDTAQVDFWLFVGPLSAAARITHFIDELASHYDAPLRLRCVHDTCEEPLRAMFRSFSDAELSAAPCPSYHYEIYLQFMQRDSGVRFAKMYLLTTDHELVINLDGKCYAKEGQYHLTDDLFGGFIKQGRRYGAAE